MLCNDPRHRTTGEDCNEACAQQYGRNRVEIEKRFTYHPPKGDQPQRYQELRDCALVLADLIDAHVPESREKALAFTNLEQAVMWSNAGIARRE